MTAPDTNLKKQKKRHKGPLIGMAVAVTVAVVFLLWMLSNNLGTEVTDEDQAAPAQDEETVGPPASGSVSGPGDTGAPQSFEPEQAPEPEPLPGE
ncbi:hypothetical protein LY56_01076 [Roseinatronobacter thiooxidans]|uniref:Uncharacterized protein n=1 Tax=Roseinatronobacter thiooxidans TaxID=121821 RepID=A0A2W7QFD4_9RHOB|nr:hypothetical protein [Roseinatronobacter thiooxidans]PZX46106.1 hypothetical protein LY56_01076 [Roseinatronobacter thiooxidans]